jgi:ABC-type phosphate/phosphonate transport system substrate-binding protein
MKFRRAITLGAVAYDPKVISIWDGFERWFAAHDLAFDYVLYRTYERQVEGFFANEHDVSWNSPLAWLQAEQLGAIRKRPVTTLAMRDTDQDLTSCVLVRRDSSVKTLHDLRGKRVGVGASDSPQATLLPLLMFAEHGVEPNEQLVIERHDVLLGKHGDHIGGERKAVQALLAGTVDAACVLDANVLGFSKDGTIEGDSVRVIAKTDPYDHCNFTAFASDQHPLTERFVQLLLSMDYADAHVRPLMDMEGLKKWCPGRVEKYSALSRAIARFGTIEDWLKHNS